MTDIIRDIEGNEVSPDGLKANGSAKSVGGAHSSARSTHKVLEISLHYFPKNHEDLGRNDLI